VEPSPRPNTSGHLGRQRWPFGKPHWKRQPLWPAQSTGRLLGDQPLLHSHAAGPGPDVAARWALLRGGWRGFQRL